MLNKYSELSEDCPEISCSLIFGIQAFPGVPAASTVFFSDYLLKPLGHAFCSILTNQATVSIFYVFFPSVLNRNLVLS